MKNPQVSGQVFDIQRFCTHDGPGIRTVVFLKGCNLGCLWCHNPEGRSSGPQIAFYSNKCIGCGRCTAVCTTGAVEARVGCVICGACAAACPSEARRLVGRDVTVADVVETVLRDEPFYRRSGGGATLSGGEPLCQPEFSHCLLEQLKSIGIHTAVETSGLAPWETLEEISRCTDLFLYDLKVIDGRRHVELCGASNEIILENARRLSRSGAEIIFRTPVVPGLNDTVEDMRQLGVFVASLPGRHLLQLMPYHRIGAGKYEALGLENPLAELTDASDLTPLCRLLEDAGVKLFEA